jgi:hypothetical protein
MIQTEEKFRKLNEKVIRNCLLIYWRSNEKFLTRLHNVTKYERKMSLLQKTCWYDNYPLDKCQVPIYCDSSFCVTIKQKNIFEDLMD